MAGVQGDGVVDGFHRAGEEHPGAGAFRHFGADAGDDFGLEHEGGDGRGEDGDGEDRQRRHAFQDEEDRQDGYQHQPGGNLELRRQDGGVQADLGRIGLVVREPEDGEDDKGDHKGRNRRDEHVPDVGEKRDLVDRRGHDGGVRQGRDLVAEIGSGDDGAGNHAVGEAFGPADAQEGHADGGDRGP